MLNYDYNIPRTKGKVLINTRDWVQPTENFTIYKMSGKTFVSGITKVLNINDNSCDSNIKKGDVILLSRIASDIVASPRIAYSLEGEKKYFDMSISQVLGTFENGKVNLDSLKLANNKVLYKVLQKNIDSNIMVSDNSTTMGVIQRLPDGYTGVLRKGMTILIKDNVSTNLYWNKEYSIVEEKDVIAEVIITQGRATLNILNNYTLMKPYISDNVLNSNILISPNINYDDLDYSDMYNRNLFKIYMTDVNTGLKVGDILLVNRDYTTYVYFNNEKFFTIEDGKKWVNARIKERDE